MRFECSNCDKIDKCNERDSYNYGLSSFSFNTQAAFCNRAWHVKFTLRNGKEIHKSIGFWNDIFNEYLQLSIPRLRSPLRRLTRKAIVKMEINGEGKITSEKPLEKMGAYLESMNNVEIIIDGKPTSYKELRVLEAL